MSNWYAIDWVASNGGYRLWPYDPKSKDPLPNPAVQDGTWATIREGHALVPVGDTGGHVIDWVPETGGYRLWRFDPTSKDPLPGPAVQEGSWESIREGHVLVPVGWGTAGYVIDWVPETGGYRLWRFDPTSKDPLPGPTVQEGTWVSIRTGHELAPVGDAVIDWVPETGGYRLWRFDHTSKDPLPGPPVQEGTWATVRAGHVLVTVARRAGLAENLSFQHAWAGSPSDLLGDVTLQAQGSPVSGVALSGLESTPFTTAGFEFQAKSTDEWRVPTATLGDFASDSVVITGLFQTVGSQPDNVILGLVGKRDPAEPHHGWEIGIDQEGRLIAMVQGDGGFQDLVVEGAATDGKWHTFVLVYDKKAGQLALHTEAASSQTVAIPGDMTTSTAMAIGRERLWAVGCRIAFVAVATGAEVDGVDGKALASSLHARYVRG